MDIGNLSLPITIPGLAMLDRLEAQMTRLNRAEQPVRIAVVVDDAAGKAQLAAFRAETARLRAEAYTVKVNADTTQAEQNIRAMNAQARLLNAQNPSIKVTADTREAESKLDALNNRIMGGIASGAGAAIGFGLVKGFGAATDAVIGFNSQLELSRVAFTQLLGSSSAADTYLKQLVEFGRITPFATEDVIKYAQRLAAVGFAAKDVIPTLTALGDAVAATGGNTETLDRVVLALGQMRTSAHLMSQDANQLVQANIPIWDILAQKMGKTQAEIRAMAENGQISGAEAAKAVIEGASERFGGLMDAQSKTFQGRLSNFKDTAKIELAAIGGANFGDLGGILDKAAEGLQSPKFKTFAADMASDLHNVTLAAEAVAGALSKVPLPVIETALHVAELAVGIRAFGAAVEFGKGVLEPLIAMTAAETAAVSADTVATEANTAAVLENNAARKAGGSGILGRAGGIGSGLLGAAGPLVALGEGLNTYPRVISDLLKGDPKQAFGDFIKNAPGTPTGAISLITGALGIGNPLNKLPFWRDSAAPGAQSGPPLPINEHPSSTATAGMTAAEMKQRDADIRQSAIDVANFQKYQIQTVSDAQIAAATKTADAWKAASAEVGRIDLSKGLSSLADAAPALDKVSLNLALLGRNEGNLDNLTRLADKFKGIADAEKAASAAFNGYMLTLSDTDKRTQQVDSIKQGFLAALDAAEQAQIRGTATAAQLDLIANKDGALAKLNAAKVSLTGNAAQDWQGIIANLPEWLKSDLNERSAVASEGGGKQLLLTVDAQTKAATDALDTFETKGREAVAKITADAKDAMAAIDALIAHMPSAIPTLFTTPAGSPDPTRGYDGTDSSAGRGGYPAVASGGAQYAGTAPPFPGPTQAGAYAFGPNNPGGAAGGSLGYQPLDQASYSKIVQSGSRGGSSPLDDPAVYASVMRAAKEANVDPIALLTFMRFENNMATNISPELNMANNFGGLKFNNQAGATPGPVSSEGDRYAAFKSPDDFFRALARNFSTGEYAGDFARGDLSAISRRYVAGDAPPSAEQQASIEARTAAYYQYRAQYAGMGAVGTLPGYGPGDTALGSGQNPTGGALNPSGAFNPAAILTAAKKHLDEMTQIDGEPWYMWCEKFVGNAVQEATGVNYRPQNADAHIRAAQAGLPGAGHVISQAQAQAGDLVGWRGDSAYAGTPLGHIGVYEGNGPNGAAGNYIGTTRQGIQERPIGPDAVFIRPDGVVAAGPVPGTVMYNSTPASRAAVGYGPGTYTSTGGTAAHAATPFDLSRQFGAFSSQLGGMNPKDITAALSHYQSMAPLLERSELAKLGPDATPTEKTQASQTAMAKNVDLARLWASALKDIRDNNGKIADDQKRIAELGLGPIAANLNEQLRSMEAQARIADRITQLTERRATLEQIAAQNARASEDATIRENSRYTGVSRGLQDRQRALQFSQQLQATDSQNRLTDLQQSQQNQIYQRTSAEQLAAKSAAGASTNREATDRAAALAAMHEQDLATRDANTKAISDLQTQIRLEQRKASLDSYNLETETIAASRTHEDNLANIEATRLANDRRSQDAISAIDKEIAAQQKLAEGEDARLTAAQSALDLWSQVDTKVAGIGTGLLNISTQITDKVLTPYDYLLKAVNGNSAAPVAKTVAPASPSANSGGTVNLNLGDVSLMLSDADKEEIKQFVQGKLDAARRANTNAKSAVGLGR